MSEPTAQRTLVKSPPELWAELSDLASLAKHLGEFGDIRITRVEPETTVVWEGDRARGTVSLEPSGWGTKVTLTATPTEPPPAPSAADPALTNDRHAVISQPATPEPPEPVQPEPPAAADPAALAAQSEPEPPPAPEPPAAATPPAPAVPAPMTANEMLAKSGFFSRVFGRRRPTADIGGPPAPTPDPAPPTPAPDPAPPVAPEPEPPAPEPAPPPPPSGPSPVPDLDPPGPDVLPEPTPLRPPDRDPEPPAAAEAPLDVESVLVGVLDTLGAAHHRPFSR